MRNATLQSTSWLAIGSAISFLFLMTLPAPAADPQTVEIKLQAGKFVLSPAQKEIKKGQSIKWKPVDLPNVTHHLKPKTPQDAFKETDDFNGSNPPTQTFETDGTINYFCTKHPASMIGSITVVPAETGK
jgi:plastocyanin